MGRSLPTRTVSSGGETSPDPSLFPGKGGSFIIEACKPIGFVLGNER